MIFAILACPEIGSRSGFAETASTSRVRGVERGSALLNNDCVTRKAERKITLASRKTYRQFKFTEIFLTSSGSDIFAAEKD